MKVRPSVKKICDKCKIINTNKDKVNNLKIVHNTNAVAAVYS